MSASTTTRAGLERRARLLAWGANAWHLIEFAIAIGAGLAAGSIALIGFGFDSLIEALAGSVIIWLFSGGRGTSETAERRATSLIAASYFLLAAYIAAESTRDLLGGAPPRGELGWHRSSSPLSLRPLCRCSREPSATSVASSARTPRRARRSRTCSVHTSQSRSWWPRRERDRRMVVGGSWRGARYRCACRARRSGHVARRALLRYLLNRQKSSVRCTPPCSSRDGKAPICSHVRIPYGPSYGRVAMRQPHGSAGRRGLAKHRRCCDPPT